MTKSFMRKIDTIVLLAGGKSDRFWPLSDKNSFIFCGQSLIHHQIETFKKLTDNLVVVINDKNSQDINLKTVIQKIPGQSGAILSAEELLRGKTLLLNANDIFDTEIF